MSVVEHKSNRVAERFCPAPNAWLQPIHSAGTRLAVLGSVALNNIFSRPVGEQFAILMYHRCSPRIPGIPSPSINVTPRRFQQQLAGLQRRGCDFWPLRRVLEARQAGTPIPNNVVVVTFDDGYENVYVHAARILRELKIPATFFVNTAYLDTEEAFPFDYWGVRYQHHSPPISYRPLTSEQCAELLEDPLFEIGAHTHTHEDFRDRPSDFFHDLERNVSQLRERFGIEQPTFAFPYGTPQLGFADPALVAAARAAGVCCALTTASQLVEPQQDPFTWGRLNVFAWDTPATLMARINGWYSWMPRQRQRVRNMLFGTPKPPRAASVRAMLPATDVQPCSMPINGSRPLISVVVPTFNRAHWLGGAIESLLQQNTDDLFDYEIIVVDNQSTDNPAAVVESIRATTAVPIHYLQQEKPGDGPTRNAGICHAQGNWIAFFDDDQFADPNWLRELYQAAWASGALVVGGPVHLDLDEEQLEALGPICRRVLREIKYYNTLRPYEARHLPGTGNALVARQLFASVGLFDESMYTGGSDSDFFKRVRQAGYELWYAPRAIIRHRIGADRLTPEYLRWDSLNGGAGHAYFDLQERGRAKTVLLGATRLARCAILTAPQYVWARYKNRPGQALGQQTSLWRTEGYLRQTLAAIAPAWFPQTEFFAWLDFRKGRSFAKDAQPLAPTTSEVVTTNDEPMISGSSAT